jgi:hypothetical protein
LSAHAIEDALDLLEAGDGAHPRAGRRSSDSPQRRVIDAALEGAEGEQVVIRFMPDGTRVIIVVPESNRVPSEQEIEDVLRGVRRGE